MLGLEREVFNESTTELDLGAGALLGLFFLMGLFGACGGWGCKEG